MPHREFPGRVEPTYSGCSGAEGASIGRTVERLNRHRTSRGAVSWFHPTRASGNQDKSRKTLKRAGCSKRRCPRREHVVDKRSVAREERSGRCEWDRCALIPVASGVSAPPQTRSDRVDNREAGSPCDLVREHGRWIDPVTEGTNGRSRDRYEGRHRARQSLCHGIGQWLRRRKHRTVLQGVDQTTSRPFVDEAGHADQPGPDRHLWSRTQRNPAPFTNRPGTRRRTGKTEHAVDNKSRVGQEPSPQPPVPSRQAGIDLATGDRRLFYVPSSQDSRYLACSSVRVSRDAPMASSLRRATDSSSSRGNT